MVFFSEGPATCPDCGKYFKSAHSLQYHSKICKKVGVDFDLWPPEFRVQNYWVSGFPGHTKTLSETQFLDKGFQLDSL